MRYGIVKNEIGGLFFAVGKWNTVKDAPNANVI